MISYFLTVDSLARSKDCLLAHIGRSSGHIDEALASGFGFRSRAALLAALRETPELDAIFDPYAFAARFSGFGHDEEDVRAASIRAICHGFENWVDADLVDGSPEDIKTAGDAMVVQHVRRKLVDLSEKLVSILVRSQVIFANPGAPPPSGNGVVFTSSVYLTDEDALGKVGVAYGIWEAEYMRSFAPGTWEKAVEFYRSDEENMPSRLSKYGIACNSSAGVRACIAQAADDLRGYGELDALQTGLYLARKLRENESGDQEEQESRRRSLVTMARRRFPALVYGVILREIYAGRSIIPSTNTKILMSAKGWSNHIRPGNSLRFVSRRPAVAPEERKPGSCAVDYLGMRLTPEYLEKAAELSRGIPHGKCLALFAGGNVYFIRNDGLQATARAATWDTHTQYTSDGLNFEDEDMLYEHIRKQLPRLLSGLSFIGMSILAMKGMSNMDDPGTFHQPGYYRARGVVELGMVDLT